MKFTFQKMLSIALLSIGIFASPFAQSKTLILYFTQPEDVPIAQLDGVSGASKIVKNNQAFGATEYLAKEIQQKVGGDLFRIETVQNYPTQHQALVDFAQDEQRKGIKPALKPLPNFADYDRIFIGYPIWWYQMPMPMYRFFEQADLAGKTLIPFVAHGGSGFSNSLAEIHRLQPRATLKEGFEYYLYRTTKADPAAEKALNAWLEKLN